MGLINVLSHLWHDYCRFEFSGSMALARIKFSHDCCPLRILLTNLCDSLVCISDYGYCRKLKSHWLPLQVRVVLWERI